MTGEARWVRADGKRPIRVDGRPASSTNASTWASFDEVRAGAGDGFGVMLGGGLACWDLDGCFTDGVLSERAREILADVSPIWVERSVSGRGLHVFVEAPEGPGRREGGGVEFYSRSRFILVTGDRFDLKGVA